MGVFNQSGGTVTISNASFDMGYNSTGNGTYNMSGGTLSVATEHVADAGKGVFNQSGGSNTISGALYVGYNGGNGTYNLAATERCRPPRNTSATPPRPPPCFSRAAA